MFLSPKEIKEKYKIGNQTLYNWRKEGKIEFQKLPSGSYVYHDLVLEKPEQNKHVIYARVSNTKQKDDLVNQKNILRSYVTKNGNIVHEELSDIASGMNENRDGLKRLMEMVQSGEVERVYVTYKDRLVRFGFGFFKEMFQMYGTEIIVLNQTKEEDFQQELTQDLISIIHHFSMKMYSDRRRKLKEIKEELLKN